MTCSSLTRCSSTSTRRARLRPKPMTLSLMAPRKPWTRLTCSKPEKMPLRMTSQNRSEQAGQQPAAAATCERPELKNWCARVRETLSSERLAHVMRVTDLAEQIALAHSFSEEETRVTVLAAILHDIARELPADELFRLAPPQLPLEFEQPHGSRTGRP